MTAYAKAGIALAVFLAGLCAGWAMNGWRGAEALSNLQAVHLGLVAAANAATVAGVKAEQAKTAALAGRLATIDGQESAALKKAQNELQTLRDGVATGRVGLRIAATCAARAPVVPGAAPGGSVDTGTSPRLTADAEQAYFSLRSGLASQQSQLAACQKALMAERNPG